jgi:hypothetical protein
MNLDERRDLGGARSALALAGALLALLAAGPARAEGSSGAGAGIDALKRGAALRKEGKFAEAIPVLLESYRLSPSVKALLNLADCEEHVGHLLDAEQHWLQAREAASKEGRAVLTEEASARLGALGPRVPRLKIALSAAAPASSRVTLDGVALRAGLLGVALPADPGRHVVEVEAEDREAASVEVWLNERDDQRLDVTAGAPRPKEEIPAPASVSPPPEPAAAAPAASPRAAEQAVSPPPVTEPHAKERAPLVYLGAGLGALGVAAAAVGVTAAVFSQKDHGDALDACGRDCASSSAAQDLQREAKDSATISTVGFVAGGVLLASGVALVVAGLRSGGATGSGGARAGWVFVAPALGPSFNGVAFQARW